MKHFLKELKRGVWDENPVLVLALGLCPALGASTSLVTGLSMGIAVTFVLCCSNAAVSLIHAFVPSRVRIPVFIAVMAVPVTAVERYMEIYFPELSHALGVYIPLIAVNCIVLARIETYASKNGIWNSILDGWVTGMGVLASLVLLGAVREATGANQLWTKALLPGVSGARVMQLAPGGFFALALICGLMNWARHRKRVK